MIKHKSDAVVPSEQQRTIRDVYSQRPFQNICIAAGAGTGKTTMLKMLAKTMSPSKKAIFLAFNNAIVDELAAKIPPYIKCSTIHKVGLRSLYSKFGAKNLKISQWKSYTIIQKFLGQWKIHIKKRTQYSMRLSHIWDFYRLHNCTNMEDIQAVMKSQGSDIPKEMLSHFRRLMQYMYDYNTRESHGMEPFMIDLVDMIYLPLKLDLKFDKYDEVFVDESQDCNKLQQGIIKKLLKPKGRFIAVGDPKQAIYSFAGADATSFKHFSDTPNTITLPLSVTYRCPKLVVDLANDVFPGLECREGASEGEVRDGDVLVEAKAGDFVLCRNTAPLLELCFQLLAMQKKVTLKGDDMVKSLLKDLKAYKNLTCNNALGKVKQKQSELILELVREGVRNPKTHSKVIKLYNLADAFMQIGKYFPNVNEAFYTIKSLSEQQDDGIVLTTMHGSKGLEADRIFIIRKGLIPNKFAKTPSQLLQEKNLWYVAVTRAKQSLITDNSF